MRLERPGRAFRPRKEEGPEGVMEVVSALRRRPGERVSASFSAAEVGVS